MRQRSFSSGGGDSVAPGGHVDRKLSGLERASVFDGARLTALILGQLQSAHCESEISMIKMMEFHGVCSSSLFADENVLVVDIGGSNVRIYEVNVARGGQCVRLARNWDITDNRLVDMSFFARIVHELRSFRFSKLGVIWSFPLIDGQVRSMGKGFHIDKSVRNRKLVDVFRQLYASGVQISIINDSAASYLSSLLDDAQNRVSVVVGTGVNACISLGSALINVELGFFGDFEVCDYDLLVDPRFAEGHAGDAFMTQSDPDRLFQPLEFLCSGMYICKLLLIILQDFHNCGLIEVQISELDGTFIADFDPCAPDSHLVQKYHASTGDIAVIRKVIALVLLRSTKILSCAIKSLLRFTAQDEHTAVYFTGSFITHCKQFQQLLVSNGIALRITDSSSIGSALSFYLL